MHYMISGTVCGKTDGHKGPCLTAWAYERAKDRVRKLQPTVAEMIDFSALAEKFTARIEAGHRADAIIRELDISVKMRKHVAKLVKESRCESCGSLFDPNGPNASINRCKPHCAYHVAPEDRQVRDFGGLSQSNPEMFQIWRNMVSRCHDPKHRQYPEYGERGIAVYEPWREDPAAFISWVLDNIGPRPPVKLSNGRAKFWLDRIDNDAGYFPGNLRWADTKVQQQNRRSTKLNPDLVRELRELAATGDYTQQTLADRYGVNISNIVAICTGRTWKNVGGPILERWPTARGAIPRRQRRAGTNDKLNLEKAREIRQRYAEGEIVARLAEAYGVSGPTIWGVVNGHTWAEPAGPQEVIPKLDKAGHQDTLEAEAELHQKIKDEKRETYGTGHLRTRYRRCHEIAFYAAANGHLPEGAMIVQGYDIATGTSFTREHTWVEFADGSTWDTVTCLPVARILGVGARYTPKEFMRRIIENGLYSYFSPVPAEAQKVRDEEREILRREMLSRAIQEGSLSTTQSQREISRRNMRALRAGVTWESLERLYEYQNGQCALCRADIALDDPKTHTDHDHGHCGYGDNMRTVNACGRCLRGLLCQPCNTLVGCYETNRIGPKVLELADQIAAYLADPPARHVELVTRGEVFDIARIIEAAETLTPVGSEAIPRVVVSELARAVRMKPGSLGTRLGRLEVKSTSYELQRTYKLEDLRALRSQLKYELAA